ncbi:MAG: transcription termination factor NusA [Bacteroidota bacterium]
MNNKELIASFTEFAGSKNIDRPTVTRMLEEMLRSLICKKFSVDSNFDIIINPNKGDLQIWRYRTIVADDSEDANEFDKISITEARKIEPDFEIGEEVAEEVSLHQFDRRDITQGLKLFLHKEQLEEKEKIHQRYTKLVGKIISAEVYHITMYQVILHDDDKNELVLPKSRQIPGDRFKKGEHIKVLVDSVDKKNNNVYIRLSRTSPLFLERLLESEVPEIADGIVQIIKVARMPGARAKVAVISQDDRIDPVGACIGAGGNRLYSLSKSSLANEHINIVQYTDNRNIFLKRLIEPAQISDIQETDKGITIKMKPDQVPLAIGKKGQNILLVSQMIGKPVHIDRDMKQDQEDIYLEEFSDEVATEVIKALQKIGIDTARSVLLTERKDIERRTNIPADVITHLYEVINKEFEV